MYATQNNTANMSKVKHYCVKKFAFCSESKTSFGSSVSEIDKHIMILVQTDDF